MKKVIDIRRPDHVNKLCNIIENLEPDMYWFEIKKYKPKRTLDQNALWWKCIVEPFANQLGYESEEMHEILKAKFLSKITILPNGEEIRHIESTTKQDTKEFSELIDKAYRLGIELGVDIELPEEY